MQVEKAENHCWNSALLPVNIGILIRSSCLFGSSDTATDDTCCVFNSISDVTLATVGDEISLTLEAKNERALLVSWSTRSIKLYVQVQKKWTTKQ